MYAALFDSEPYFQPPHSGPRCSTARTARLRELRASMRDWDTPEPETTRILAATARDILLREEAVDLALARARALAYIADNYPICLQKDILLLGGEDPHMFNVLHPALNADRYARDRACAPTAPPVRALLDACVITEPCFEGHITPGTEQILSQGTDGLRWRIQAQREHWRTCGQEDVQRDLWFEAALICCDTIDQYANRLRQAALSQASSIDDPEWAAALRAAADVLSVVPRLPARTLHEALQAYWLVYILITIEMGGCMPGGGLGLGRPDQYLYPYYCRDIASGRLSRQSALELIEAWLLCFQHCDYYTPHAIYTVGSQASIGGVTASGDDASNELTELIMEASLRIQMPTPYISVRLHPDAPERYWQAATNFVLGGLGFSIVNDSVLIPAFLKHGRSITDARDYICSCCYEFTIPGREAFHPGGTFINLPAVLDLTLHRGRHAARNLSAGIDSGDVNQFTSFDALMQAFQAQLDYVIDQATTYVNTDDARRMAGRRFPLMSLFIDDCIAEGRDVCAGGARYDLTGMIVAGLPNVINSLAAIQHTVFTRCQLSLRQIIQAIDEDYQGFPDIRHKLQRAPKWGNGDPFTGKIAEELSNMIYKRLSKCRNARGGRWQAALYSFVANHFMGESLGATPDGRQSGEILTRNLNPAWGTDHNGPTAVLESLAHIDFTQFPNGGTLDLRFDPSPFLGGSGRALFTAFLKTFVDMKLMQMQITMADTDTLLDAQAHPERWPNLMVKVAGYSARFVTLDKREQDEIIGRSMQSMTV